MPFFSYFLRAYFSLLISFLTWILRAKHIYNPQQEIHDDTNTAAAMQSGRLKGRKMGMEDATKKEERNEMTTGANLSSAAKRGHGERSRLSLACMLMSTRVLPSRFSLGDFIPLSADYHVPKGHSPKNN